MLFLKKTMILYILLIYDEALRKKQKIWNRKQKSRLGVLVREGGGGGGGYF